MINEVNPIVRIKQIKVLEGKTIVKAQLRRINKKFNDVPFLDLIMSDGSVYTIVSDYGGYGNGEAEDEYPRFITVIKKVKQKNDKKT